MRLRLPAALAALSAVLALASGCAPSRPAASASAAPQPARLEPVAWDTTARPDSIAAWARRGCRGLLGTDPKCVERALLSVIEPAGVARAMAALDVLVETDGVVRREAHGLAHSMGINAYRSPETVAATFAACPPTQMSGCYHGVIQGFFLAEQKKPGGVTDQAINALCEPHRSSSFLFFQCAHGLGHGVMSMERHHLPRALKACDRATDGFVRESCYGGVFMENIVAFTHPHHTAEAHADGGHGDHGAASSDGEHAGHGAASADGEHAAHGASAEGEHAGHAQSSAEGEHAGHAAHGQASAEGGHAQHAATCQGEHANHAESCKAEHAPLAAAGGNAAGQGAKPAEGGHEGHTGHTHASAGGEHANHGAASAAGDHANHGADAAKGGARAASAERWQPLKPSDPLYPCTVVEAKYQNACYMNQSSAILYMSNGSVGSVARHCGTAPEAMRSVCYRSLGRDITALAERGHARSIELCGRAGDGEAWCLAGVAENLVNLAADPAEGMRFCKLVEGEANKGPCYVAVGKMVFGLEPAAPRRETVCATAEADYVERCRSGAGLLPRQTEAK